MTSPPSYGFFTPPGCPTVTGDLNRSWNAYNRFVLDPVEDA